MLLLAYLLLALVAGSLVYCLLAVVAVRRYLAVRPSCARALPPMSVLRPLAGLDEGLEENLRSTFAQQYPAFEILFAVRAESDPAVPVVRRLQQEYAAVPSQLLLVGEPAYDNAKVFSLERMAQAARHDLLVMVDSDVRVPPGLLRVLAAEFSEPGVGVITCPYRAVPGGRLWSQLEAIGMNTEFLAGVLTARMLDGMRFALGPTIAARRGVLEEIGGFGRLKDYLAEDFVMGQRAAEKGHTVVLSSAVIEHRIGSQDWRRNAGHRLRWFRSTRRSRPAGYVGQVFTNPLPLALLLVAVMPAWWPVLVATALVRAVLGWATAAAVLHDPLCTRRWWLVPVQDVLSFVFWVAGFFGNTIQWRGRRYYLHADGRFELVPRD